MTLKVLNSKRQRRNILKDVKAKGSIIAVTEHTDTVVMSDSDSPDDLKDTSAIYDLGKVYMTL